MKGDIFMICFYFILGLFFLSLGLFVKDLILQLSGAGCLFGAGAGFWRVYD